MTFINLSNTWLLAGEEVKSLPNVGDAQCGDVEKKGKNFASVQFFFADFRLIWILNHIQIVLSSQSEYSHSSTPSLSFWGRRVHASITTSRLVVYCNSLLSRLPLESRR